ncbi:MAG TPA: hypothetical protein VM389_05435 [Phycisphaerae bacterium]|nr:hypothetical protein [Phycisphaerae bacterium]
MPICYSAVIPAVALALAAAQGDAPAQLGDPVELLKLPKDELPPITFARPIACLSPDGTRMLYIRTHGAAKAKLHLRRVGEPQSDGPAVWDEPIPALYCRMSFPGIAWRADGQRVLFCQEPARDEDGWAEGVHGRRMRPWHMCWDLPNPQFKLCRYMQLTDAPGCTGLSYSPDGSVLYTALSDVEGHKACGVTAWDSGRQRGRTVYQRKGTAIYHLVPSPDGKHLAWVETYPRKKGQEFRGPGVVAFNLKAGKVVLRAGLSKDIPGWLDAQPPVWTADSTGLCYGDVAEIDGIWRREVKVADLAGGDEKLLVRDALAVGAVPEGIVLNRGPGCVPMSQELSSYAPPGGSPVPRSDDVILCERARPGEFATLVPNAFAHQVTGRRLVYAQASAGDVLLLRAEVKPASSPVSAGQPRP